MELYQQISAAIKLFDRYWRKKLESVPQKPVAKEK